MKKKLLVTPFDSRRRREKIVDRHFKNESSRNTCCLQKDLGEIRHVKAIRRKIRAFCLA